MEVKDRELLYCPIAKGYCLEEKCIWYMGAWNTCAVVAIACDTDSIADNNIGEVSIDE